MQRDVQKRNTKITGKNEMEIFSFFCKTFSTLAFFQKFFLVFLNSALRKRLKNTIKKMQVGGGGEEVGGCFLDGFRRCTWAFGFLFLIV
jgi:hypothetical protein